MITVTAVAQKVNHAYHARAETAEQQSVGSEAFKNNHATLGLKRSRPRDPVMSVFLQRPAVKDKDRERGFLGETCQVPEEGKGGSPKRDMISDLASISPLVHGANKTSTGAAALGFLFLRILEHACSPKNCRHQTSIAPGESRTHLLN